MQFNSFIFIGYLIFIILGYFLINKVSWKLSNLFLVLMSFVFYSVSGFSNLLCLIVSITVNYFLIRILEKNSNKVILWVGIVFNIGMLFFFKYINFTILSINSIFSQQINTLNIFLPLGISFFTFQQIAYLVVTYKKDIETYSFTEYLLYVTFFPKLLMGPITEPRELIAQFRDENRRKVSFDNISNGIQLFTVGLLKKVILADTFARAVNWAWNTGDFSSTTYIDLILVMIAYSFQIYFDFSGYSDMAVASALMLNIELPINFDSPYRSLSIRDFWERWHISLTKFLTRYIYIPLGGNRKCKVRTYVNILLVFLVSGVWHGANWTFVLWGILHGVLSVFDRITDSISEKIPKIVRWLLNFFTVSILWLLFRANSISEWIHILKQIILHQGNGISNGLIESFYLPETDFFNTILHLWGMQSVYSPLWLTFFYVLAFAVCIVPKNSNNMKCKSSVASAMIFAVTFVFLLTCIGSESVFVYFNF